MTRIAIDPARPVGRLDRKVFGGFVEHLGRCIYGGLYEEGSPLSDDRGFRKDVLGLLCAYCAELGTEPYICLNMDWPLTSGWSRCSAASSTSASPSTRRRPPGGGRRGHAITG